MKHEQPAERSYFFHGGFLDLGEVIAGAFKNCGEAISTSAEGIAGAWSKISDFDGILKIVGFLISLFLFSFYLIRLISTAVVTPLICVFITIFQITILLVFFIIMLIFFLIIIIMDRIYCTINAIATHCPVCQNHFSIPIYTCPKCNVEHDRLRPGIYGIMWRKCNCNKILPTTFFNGRQKLQAQCPACKNNIKDGGLQASWCIPVVGGPSSGKTCYINMTMMSLEKKAQSQYGLRFVYENNGLDEYKKNSDRLSKGYVPDKTEDHRLRYYQFSLTPRGATKQQISLCDVAGELFDVSTGSEINRQSGFIYANAFILLIDPLSIPDYRNEMSKTANISGYNGSVQRLDEMVDTFVRTLQNMFSIKANAMLNTDVAVVFTKVDIPGLDIKIGKSAVLKKAPSLEQRIKNKVQNELCEQFLREYNEDSFLNNLKSRFKSVQFFTCSALGHVENGQPFTASNVEEPFFWLVKKKSNVINRAIK
jgi:GTPase SAR1 family protein